MINIKELKLFWKWMEEKEYWTNTDPDPYWTDCYVDNFNTLICDINNTEVIPHQMLIGHMEQYLFEIHHIFISGVFSNAKKDLKRSFIDKRYEQLIDEIKLLDKKRMVKV
jgi:hypothetical protein